METNGEASLPTPEQARAALADTDDVRVSVEALSATPWPTWFVATITAMFVVLPITFGGALAEPDWLMPQGHGWPSCWGPGGVPRVLRRRGQELARQDGRGTAPRRPAQARHRAALVGTPLLIVGSGYAFRYTDQPLWLFAASAAGAALSIGFHLWFVRLHRKAS